MIKASDNEETNENKPIQNVLHSIAFDTMGNKEEQNQNSDSESVEFEGFSESNEFHFMIRRELMNNEILELLSTMPLDHPKLSK